MTLCPGLVGEVVPSAMFRAYLGAPPQLAVEKRLLRHMTSFTPIGSWFVSRRRIREAANEYIEFDGSTVDTDIMLRHCHIFFVRRQLFNEILEKQVSILEAGKPPREPEPELLACLSEINESIAPRVMYERKRLEHAKALSTLPHRRELLPTDPLDRWDTLAMIRCLEHDVISEEYVSPITGNTTFSREFVATAEAQAKAFLPLSAVVDSAEKLAQLFVRIGASVAADAAQIPQELKPLDKKDEKLVQKTFVPGDYQKSGLLLPRLRPTDATSYFRFYGERALNSNFPSGAAAKDPIFYFRRAMWGNVFRRYATNPSFLANSMSQYWALSQKAAEGLHPNPPLSKMPFEIADIVCRQQVDICPATKLRAQFMYCHQDHAKQLWRSEMTVPSIRMLSTTGAQCAEDMLSSILVDAFFNELEGRQIPVVAEFADNNNKNNTNNNNTNNSAEGEEKSKTEGEETKEEEGEQQQQQRRPVRMLTTTTSSSTTTNTESIPLLSDEKMRQVVMFVNEMIALRASSMETLLQRAQTSLKNIVSPPLSDDEADWQAPAIVTTNNKNNNNEMNSVEEEEGEGEEIDNDGEVEEGVVEDKQ